MNSMLGGITESWISIWHGIMGSLGYWVLVLGLFASIIAGLFQRRGIGRLVHQCRLGATCTLWLSEVVALRGM